MEGNKVGMKDDNARLGHYLLVFPKANLASPDYGGAGLGHSILFHDTTPEKVLQNMADREVVNLDNCMIYEVAKAWRIRQNQWHLEEA